MSYKVEYTQIGPMAVESATVKKVKQMFALDNWTHDLNVFGDIVTTTKYRNYGEACKQWLGEEASENVDKLYEVIDDVMINCILRSWNEDQLVLYVETDYEQGIQKQVTLEQAIDQELDTAIKASGQFDMLTDGKHVHVSWNWNQDFDNVQWRILIDNKYKTTNMYYNR